MNSPSKSFRYSRKCIKPFAALLVIAVCVLMLSACAGAQKKFRKSTVADVGIFADFTIAMLHDADFSFAQGQALYTRDLYELGEIEEQRWIESKLRVETVLNVMISYSLRIVTIAETEKTEQNRIQAYADYLNRVDDQVLNALGLEKDHYQAVIAKIREEEKLLGALRAAQPVINAMGRYMEKALKDLETASAELVEKLDQKIDWEFADVIRYQQTLESEKYAVLGGLEQLYLFSKGDSAGFERLKESDVITSASLVPAGTPTEDDLTAMTDYLVQRLDRIHRIGEEIEPDFKVYRDTHRELDQLYEKTKADIRRARLTNIIWLRAHQKMASGRVNPAEWFDINDAPGMMLRMGTKAVGL